MAASLESGGRVAELGCGPGHVGAYLAARGVDVVGLDLSPAMVEQAHRLFPKLEVVVGDMLDLPFPNESLAGIVAFYSIIHFDDEQLARAFAEMRRVTSAEGQVAFAFHIGDEVLHREQWWDMPVVLDSRFLAPDLITRLLAEAGFAVLANLERPPYPDVEYQSRRAYVVARPLLPLPNGEALPPFGLGYTRTETRRKLVDAVLHGNKIATAGLARFFAPNTYEPLPAVGDRWALLGFDDEPVAVVETTYVEVVPAGQIGLEFAVDEGEGFESVAQWRSAHERFWSGFEITDETLIVAEHFRVVERFDQG